MQNRPEIILPKGLWCVRTSEIPDLITVALHPDPNADLRNPVTDFSKMTSTAGESGLRHHQAPLNDDDWATLRRIFAHLPPLELPIAQDAFQPYAEAFQQRTEALDWHLIGNNSSLFQVRVLRAFVKTNHEKLLRDAISNGTLEQLNPDTQIPTTIYLEDGKVVSVPPTHLDI